MVNKVTLMGHLGKEPVVRRTEAGIPVATFSVATNESYKDKDGNKVDKTEWHNVVIWRGLAEVAEKYLKKGSLVYLEGKLQTRSYQAQDGTTKYTTEIVCDVMKMVGGKPEGGTAETPANREPQNPALANVPKNTATATATADTPPPIADEDLPF